MARTTDDAGLSTVDAGPRVPLEIKVLGQFQITWRGRTIPLKSRKSRALIGYLALSEGRSESRERLVGLLWSEVDEARARQSLRQSLHEIRVAFAEAGVDGMITDRLVVGMTLAQPDVDVARVVEEARTGRPGPSLFERDRLFDSLLDQFENLDPGYRMWLLPRRRSLELRVAAHLEEHVRNRQLPGRDLEANARALLRLDPTNELAVRTVMTARADVGDTGGALRHYSEFWALLDQEYGQEPSAETQDCAVAIKLIGSTGTGRSGGAIAEPAPAVALPVPAPAPLAVQTRDLKLSVSIGDFDTASVAPAHRYLVHGFRRELIASLVRFREWSVRDVSGRADTDRDLGGADAAADGTSASAGGIRLDVHAADGPDAIRLVLTMQQSDNREYIWSDELRLSLSTWCDAQETVVRRLAAALQVNVSAGRLAAVTRNDLASPLAYDLWLKCQDQILSWEPRARAEAAEVLARVIVVAPNFSPAYSSLAQLDNTMPFAHPGMPRDPIRAARAIDNASRATRIDPIDSRAQLALGWAFLMADDFDAAIHHAGIALGLNDTDQLTALSAAQILSFCGDHDRAVALVVRARQIFPRFSRLHWAHQVGIRFLAGDYVGAVAASQMERTLIPTLAGFRIAALRHLGRDVEAEAERREYLADLRSRWSVPLPATDGAIRDWFLAATPLRRRTDWERLRAGFDGR